MKPSTRMCRRPGLALGIALVLASGLPAASAATVHLDGIASAPSHQQFIVGYREGRVAQAGAAARASGLLLAAGSLSRPTRATALRTLAIGSTVVRTDRALDSAEAAQFLHALASDPDVDYVQVDELMQATRTPNDPRLVEQWGFGTSAASLNVRPAWDIATGKGQIVAVLDTGITAHPDLAANVIPGYDFISDSFIAGDGDGRDADASDPGDAEGGRASSWHGTHVAGTVAAVTDNALGVAGTAFAAKVQPVRVLGKGGGYTSDIADGMVWAAGGAVSGVPANPTPAKVLNLSLGGGGSCNPASLRAIVKARQLGATVVVAAGNDGRDVSTSSPANCPGVVAVAAINEQGGRAWFSNYGAGITLAAPGQGILSTLNTGQTGPGTPSYARYDGTSMAAPHVAGLVALMQSAAAKPLSPDEVTKILTRTARPLPGACPQGCGAGLADALAAVKHVRDGSPGGPDPAPIELADGVPVQISAKLGEDRLYTFQVPEGRQNLTVSINGGSGNADLYTRYGVAPTDELFNCRPASSSNSETCLRLFPDAGPWHIRVKATSDYSGVMLTARSR